MSMAENEALDASVRGNSGPRRPALAVFEGALGSASGTPLAIARTRVLMTPRRELHARDVENKPMKGV